jgi:hypothetical protein
VNGSIVMCDSTSVRPLSIDKAVAAAAQKARACEQQGDSAQAETWRHVEAALQVMRGPRAS